MSVFTYTRVSTDRQADEGESLGAQQRQLDGYAMQHLLTITDRHEERGVSGSTPLDERPEGARLLDRLQPGDVILTPKLDRMFRSASDALRVLDDLKARGVALHMLDLGGDVTGNGISKLVFTILSAVAEAERDRTRERIRDVKRDQRARGRFLGGAIPFGFKQDDDGQLIEDAAQQAAIAAMRASAAAGDSLRKIAASLAAQGFQLSHMGVAKVLARAKS